LSCHSDREQVESIFLYQRETIEVAKLRQGGLMENEGKLIDYLSKEIETQTKNLMIFRERINFAVFIGPFVLLGAILYGGIIPRINWGSLTRTAKIGFALSLLLAILSYLTMGIACSRIEKHMWDQCNVWRERIADISSGRKTAFTIEDLRFEEHLKEGYLWVYLAMVIAFVSAIALVLILQAYAVPLK